MKELKLTLSLLIISLFANLLLMPQRGYSEQLKVQSSTVNAEEQGYENWNSHINNQAYLQQLQRQNNSSSSHNSTVIVLQREKQSSLSRSRSNRHNNCIYLGCDSWGAQYQSNNFSFSYQEGYRPNRDINIYIKNPKPEHYKKNTVRPTSSK